MRAPLPLGRVVATPGALELLKGAGGNPFDYLARHATGDWGELCTFDRRQNEIALRGGYRVLSSYPVGRRLDHHRGGPLCHHHPSSRGVLMSCELCVGGDEWIKTCLTPEGSRLLVCDECYDENASVLVIVPGDRVVTARCDYCWCYGNPREFVVVSPGGRKNAYSGTCATCVGEEGS